MVLRELHDKTNGTDEYASYGDSTWYGAVYYEIVPLHAKKDTCYLLLGWDGNNWMSKKKLIEPISFNSNGKIHFGQKILKDKEEVFVPVTRQSSCHRTGKSFWRRRKPDEARARIDGRRRHPHGLSSCRLRRLGRARRPNHSRKSCNNLRAPTQERTFVDEQRHLQRRRPRIASNRRQKVNSAMQIAISRNANLWARRGLNPGPPPCRGGALPTELHALIA